MVIFMIRYTIFLSYCCSKDLSKIYRSYTTTPKEESLPEQKIIDHTNLYGTPLIKSPCFITQNLTFSVSAIYFANLVWLGDWFCRCLKWKSSKLAVDIKIVFCISRHREDDFYREAGSWYAFVIFPLFFFIKHNISHF